MTEAKAHLEAKLRFQGLLPIPEVKIVTDEQHRIEVLKSLHSNPDYTAFCSCGWVGRSWKTEDEAEQDGDAHVIALSH